MKFISKVHYNFQYHYVVDDSDDSDDDDQPGAGPVCATTSIKHKTSSKG